MVDGRDWRVEFAERGRSSFARTGRGLSGGDQSMVTAKNHK